MSLVFIEKYNVLSVNDRFPDVVLSFLQLKSFQIINKYLYARCYVLMGVICTSGSQVQLSDTFQKYNNKHTFNNEFGFYNNCNKNRIL